MPTQKTFVIALFSLSLTCPSAAWATVRLEPVSPYFGSTFVADRVEAIRIDSQNQKLSFRFTAGMVMAVDAVGLYCPLANGAPSYHVSIQTDKKGKPSGDVLSQSSIQPAGGAWATLSIKAVSLAQGQVYHLVIQPDTLRGGEHAVSHIHMEAFAAFGATSPLHLKHAADESADEAAQTLHFDGSKWKNLDLQPVYLLYGRGRNLQGNPYMLPGERPIHGSDSPNDESDDLWQAQVLHPACGANPKSISLRVRRKGKPPHELRFTLLKHNFGLHKTFPVHESLAVTADQVSEDWQWIEVAIPVGSNVSIAPECYYFAFHTRSGKAAGGSCIDCYLISDNGATPGAAGLAQLGFDSGPHRSRASSSINAGHWLDDFERDAHVVMSAPLCPPIQVPLHTPLPTPMPAFETQP